MRCISCAEFSHLYWTLGKKHRRLPSPRATASVSKRSPPHFLRVCSGLPDWRGSRNAPLRGGEQTTEEESRYSTEIEPGGRAIRRSRQVIAAPKPNFFTAKVNPVCLKFNQRRKIRLWPAGLHSVDIALF